MEKFKTVLSFALGITGFLILLKVDYRIAVAVLLIIVGNEID